MRSIIGGIIDRAPVPLGARDSLFSMPDLEKPRKRDLKAMQSQSTIFAIVDGIASEVAAAEWRLFRKAPRREDRERVMRHPALTVWNNPNPHYTRTELVESIMQHNELVGEMWTVIAYAELLRGEGPPLELWPVRPDRMEPVKSRRQFITGYVYRAGSTEIPLALKQVMFHKRPNPMDPYRGIGPVGSLVLDIEGEHAASVWNRQFFRNGAEPGGIIKTPRELDDPEFEQFLERWRMSHRGVSNAHRVGLLEGDFEWTERKYTQRDMQFEQLRRYSREMIRQAWRFPKPLLGDVEDVNRANAEAADVVFSKRLITPRLNRLRTMLNDDFLPRFGSAGDGFEFDYESVTPPNREEERLDFDSRVSAATSLIDAGFDAAGTLAAFELPAIDFVGRSEMPQEAPPA